MLKVGDRVKWNDPNIEDYSKEERQNALKRVFTIDSISGDIYLISDGYSEAEVTKNELKKVK